MEGDIKGCFDNIGHDKLPKDTSMDKKILRKWLKCGYVEKKKLFPTEKGTPQGGVISPTLANIALDGLEEVLKTFRGQKVNLVRYADDFVITGASKELLENEVKPLVKEFLAFRGLELSEEKTKITHIGEGFDFLGQNVRKYDGKLIIKPAKKNIKNFLTKVRGIINDNKTAKQEGLISLLNPVIRGWANYHQHVCSKETYSKMDNIIWRWLWQWTKRRHPNKTAYWTKNRYFKQVRFRNNVFGTHAADTKGEKRWVELWLASTTPIKRHVKVRSDANPFDSKWKTYFESRDELKVSEELRTRRRLRGIWEAQGRKCPVCKMLVKPGNWHQHHRVPKHMGGTDDPSNIVLLHPNCHMLVTVKKLVV